MFHIRNQSRLMTSFVHDSVSYIVNMRRPIVQLVALWMCRKFKTPSCRAESWFKSYRGLLHTRRLANSAIKRTLAVYYLSVSKTCLGYCITTLFHNEDNQRRHPSFSRLGTGTVRILCLHFPVSWAAFLSPFFCSPVRSLYTAGLRPSLYFSIYYKYLSLSLYKSFSVFLFLFMSFSVFVYLSMSLSVLPCLSLSFFMSFSVVCSVSLSAFFLSLSPDQDQDRCTLVTRGKRFFNLCWRGYYTMSRNMGLSSEGIDQFTTNTNRPSNKRGGGGWWAGLQSNIIMSW